ncbi:GTPase family protein [Myxosarcina sp. GI1]|uniref:GTPase family protein n=1 Tax=Myxosarcina sp. GI1 TaxID=1541065 RepID=UPI00055B8280|nr:GTPase family protein [Myxosarcina sp. GI1]
MIRLKPWQLAILALPIATIVIFLLVAAGWQIHRWGINWIWGIVILIFAVWRWLLAKWTKPPLAELEATIEEAERELTTDTENSLKAGSNTEAANQVRTALQQVIAATKDDPPIWEDWQLFWQRCQELVTKVSQAYHPEVKRPLLNIYIPQAYGLIRGTVDDTDRLMQKLTPVLERVSIGQAYEAYEVYRKLEPSARKLGKVFNWSQWLLNPVAAVAKRASKYSNVQANQQLVANLGQLIRETALKNLCQQAIALYGKETITLPEVVSEPTLPKAKTKTLKEIIETAEPVEAVERKPVSILLVGRTGAGKSSVINTLFRAEKAEVDVLPSTDRIQNYRWMSDSKETLNLWDTPGYEQVNGAELKQEVLEYASTADLLLLVTPALDPALQMDVDFIAELKETVADLPAIAIVTQVDRLRPIREWNPPYSWQQGDRPKEKSIREATQYRAELLGDICQPILPLVTADKGSDRNPWNVEALSTEILKAIDPAKQLRLARFMRDRETRSKEAARIIDRYTRQMSTTQGLTALLKSPILQFISTMTTGNPALAYALAEQIPVEQLPLVIGKLQMAYDLFGLLSNEPNLRNFDLLSLWSLLLENEAAPDRNAWAFGHALVEYWTKNLSVDRLRQRYQYYLEEARSS